MVVNSQADLGAHAWRSLVIVSLAQMMVVLDATIVFIGLPTIQADLGMSLHSVQWIVNAYGLAIGGFLLLGGRLADLLGRRRMLIAGTALFTAASLLNALAQTGDVLIASRALQGFGAALASPAALSVVSTCFENRPDRAKAMSAWGAITATGGALGLIAGGLLTDWLGWQWLFFVNLPLGLAVIAAALRWVPELPGSGARRGFDVAGAVTGTGGIVALTYTMVQTTDHGWGSARTIELALLALLLLGAFLAIEATSRQPLVRLSIFRVRALTVSNVALAVVMSIAMSSFFFVTIYLQEILEMSAIEAAVGFMPYMACVMVGSAVSTFVMRRAGIRPTVLVGSAIGVIAMLVLSRVSGAGDYASVILIGITLFGIGLGLSFVPLTLTATAGVDAVDSGLAAGIYNTSLQLGAAIGVAAMSTIAEDRALNSGIAGPGAVVEGYQFGFMVAAGVLAAGGAFVFATLRRRDVEGIPLDEPLTVPA